MEKNLTWIDRLVGRFGLEAAHHRTCRLCHKRVLRTQKYCHVAGLFGVDRIEHRNCANPTMESPDQLAQHLTPELPFDAPGQSINITHQQIIPVSFHPLVEEDQPFVNGAIYPTCGNLHQEKIQ